MSPVKHDRILGSISHLPHLMAAALVNASDFEDLKLAGRGFLDTSRIASGPANVWTDIFMTNSKNTARDIDRVIKELTKLKSAIKAQKPDQIEKLLEAARQKREKFISYKVKKGEILI
jgi:prephenate dehydrogenase